MSEGEGGPPSPRTISRRGKCELERKPEYPRFAKLPTSALAITATDAGADVTRSETKPRGPVRGFEANLLGTGVDRPITLKRAREDAESLAGIDRDRRIYGSDVEREQREGAFDLCTYELYTRVPNYRVLMLLKLETPGINGARAV